MAKVTITFEDLDEGVEVKVESDPAISMDDKELLTNAQEMAVRMSSIIIEELSHTNEVTEIHKNDGEEECDYHGHQV